MMNELHIGEKNKVCAACRLPFDLTRKDAGAVRIGFENLPVNFFFEYQICAVCLATYKRGGADRDCVLAGVAAFHEGEEASQ